MTIKQGKDGSWCAFQVHLGRKLVADGATPKEAMLAVYEMMQATESKQPRVKQ